MRIFTKKTILWLIILLSFASAYIDLPKDYPLKINLPYMKIDQKISSPQIDWKLGPLSFKRDLNIRKGLDIQGGVHLVLEAKMDGITESDRGGALESARKVIERRVDLFGVAEPVIQTLQGGGNYRISVDLPGLTNTDEAIALIGKTAQLDFRELPPGVEASQAANIFQFQKSGLTGAQLQRAILDYSPETGEPVVAITFNEEGSQKFKEITSRNVGKPVAIFLDEIPVTVPRVNEPITDGSAIISGSFDAKEAKELAIQLNAGALPVPISIVEQKNIGATLGQESVVKSVRAGLIGLSLVVLFMWLLYGRLGLLANMALVIYGLVTLAIYKLVPVTLSLPGLAGFILSVGMAVDSNILIFERMKEEINMGKPRGIAMELGFGRAWDSIKDANVATLITCFVLFNPFNWSFLNTSGLVRGFALTLALGVLISLFTGIIVTRTFIRTFYKTKIK